MEGVLFNSPIILGGFFLALIILVFELRTNSTGYFLPVISVILTVAVTIYAILLGATLQEITIVLLVFVIINLAVLKNQQINPLDESNKKEDKQGEKSEQKNVKMEDKGE